MDVPKNVPSTAEERGGRAPARERRGGESMAAPSSRGRQRVSRLATVGVAEVRFI